ncbi:hypothetical protein PMIN01_07147 [Paraphaeosphaeria minitans]|uniref:Uncharacterized protein n=1 Tax=Paraphaeosphaeria minitans TaxID=565426 RepID=A0A9P6KQ44_9PLEO|nr:hypothetical protein PMIN01_07147 [Paraphaeosphaeria minitans]
MGRGLHAFKLAHGDGRVLDVRYVIPGVVGGQRSGWRQFRYGSVDLGRLDMVSEKWKRESGASHRNFKSRVVSGGASAHLVVRSRRAKGAMVDGNGAVKEPCGCDDRAHFGLGLHKARARRRPTASGGHAG